MGLLWLIPEDKMTGLIILGSGLGSLMLSCCCYSVHRCTEMDDEEETAAESFVQDLNSYRRIHIL